MTFEEAILKIATALVYEKSMTPQETARAAAEAIGLRQMMDDAACWRELDDFRNHLAEQLIEQTAAHLKSNGSAQ